MVTKKEQKKNIGRAITVLLLGIIISTFLTFNSPEGFNAGILYSFLGIITIGAYLVWDKF